MANQSIFITGTDTGVGKTTMTAALLLALQQQGESVGVLKPIETGINEENPQHSDTERLRCWLSPPPLFNEVCLYALPEPLAPLAAARKRGVTIDPSRIRSHVATFAQQYSYLLIEGAGGLFTPIAPQYTMRDLLMLLNLPCLIVARTDLGGVNHALLTIEALKQVGIKISGIVVNEHQSLNNTAFIQEQRESTMTLIREESSVPVFGPIPFTQKIEESWKEGVRILSENSEIQRLAIHLIERETNTE